MYLPDVIPEIRAANYPESTVKIYGFLLSRE